MDLNKLYSYKRRLRIGDFNFAQFWKICFCLTLVCAVVNSWRITQKCPHGHYYNDGCMACWCDIRTGLTKCERLLQCSSKTQSHGTCPFGRQYKDKCGNDCTCYESTGAVFCNEKIKCQPNLGVVPNPYPVMSTLPPIPVTLKLQPIPVPVVVPIINSNNFSSRSGAPVKRFSIPILDKSENYGPQIASTYPPFQPETSGRSSIFDNVVMSSTPRPHQLHLPGKSAELIIEPAIIVRKKGSNKASVIRNPSSATEVTLSSRNRHHSTSKSDDMYPSMQKSASSLAPLNLYAKQLKTIMDIKRAYAQMLRSKVNFNFQIETGKGPVTARNDHSSVSSSKYKLPFNSLMVLERNDNQNVLNSGSQYSQYSTTEHPRRFDENYDNGTIYIDTPSSTTMRPNNFPKKPLFWRHKEHIKNTLKNFSPVPPLKQLVSFVSTSTESYLSNLLSNPKSKQRERLDLQSFHPDTAITPAPYPPPPQIPTNPTMPSPMYPVYSFSTIEPQQELQNDHNSMVPIHEVYQNHDLNSMSTTPAPNYFSNRDNNFADQSYIAQHFDNRNAVKHEPEYSNQFPFMTELMKEIARADHLPTAVSPTKSPALTAVPTFQTPGPPYAEIDVVQPLSFLPPPQPEPATPTHRTLMVGSGARHPLPVFLPNPNRARPTVRVNLDKPIYVNKPPAQKTQFTPYQHQQQPLPNYNQRNSIQIQTAYRPPPHLPTRPPPPPPNRRTHSLPSIITKLHFFPNNLNNANRRNSHYHQQHQYHYNPPSHHHQPIYPSYQTSQFFIPKPKHYRVVLKGKIKDDAVKVDDAVPRFVSRIAHEFFKKPDIYVPKIRPGKPLTLEKVVLNHDAIVPKEVSWSTTPGTPTTKLRFTPEAQWKMREDLAKHGIMLNTPINTPSSVGSYANDPNVMEMDAPVTALNTWETHTGVSAGTYRPGYPSPGESVIHSNQGYSYYPALPASSTTAAPLYESTTVSPLSIDHQIQQQLQHQILLSQHKHQHDREQEQQQHIYQTDTVLSSGFNNGNAFSIDPNDFNDFSHHNTEDTLPPQLNIPGVKQVVVDKFVIRDPLNPSGDIQVYSTTTVEPPYESTTKKSDVNVDLASLLSQYNTHRNGVPIIPISPTPPPAVLIRHHGAPSPSPPPEIQVTTPTPSISMAQGNLLFSWIQSTPKPHSTTIAPSMAFGNSFQMNPLNSAGAMGIVTTTEAPSIANQIHEFLSEKMDFGASPQMNIYDMLFNSRAGIAPDGSSHDQNSFNHNKYNEAKIAVDEPDNFGQVYAHDQLAAATNLSDSKVETDNVASIFSIDYQNKFNRKPPAVIVINVPSNTNQEDSSSLEVIEKRLGEEIEIKKAGALGKNPYPRHEDEDSEESFYSRKTEATNDGYKSSQSSSERKINSREHSRRKNRRRGGKGKRRRKKKRRNRKKESNKENDKIHSEAKGTESDYKVLKHSSKEQSNFDNQKAEEKFQSELDWKSKLMANICELNPSSPLCLTYRSICLLMTSSTES